MNVGIYQADKYTAYFYPKRIVICTNLQCFSISYPNNNQKGLLDELTIDIMRGRVQTILDIKTEGILQWENCSRPQYSQLD